MKALICVAFLTSTLALWGQPSVPSATPVGPHETLWQVTDVDDQGQPFIRSWNELATGLNWFSPDTGQYERTVEAFDIAPDGSAVALRGQTQVILASDIAQEGAVDLQMPDGVRLLSNPMWLSFFDPTTGQNVLLAQVTNCVGQLIAPNMVLFPKAFDTLDAAICYTYRKDGFSQDIILYQNPGSPQDWGLSAAAKLQVGTEFHDYVPPVQTAVATPDGVDETLDFGQTRMGAGQAYFLDANLQSVGVLKTWDQVNGRQFLFEEISYEAAAPLLQNLQSRLAKPSAAELARRTTKDRAGLMALVSPRRPHLVAAIQRSSRKREAGCVLDYSTLNTSLTNYTFKGDVTYFLSGNVGLYSSSVFEGGTVLKITNGVTLSANGPITWGGSPFRPIVITGRDDPSVGESITPTNALSGYYAATALQIIGGSTNTLNLQNLRIAYAQTALSLDGGAAHTISHAQVVNCQRGIVATNSEFRLRNALFNNVLTNFAGSSSTGRVEHLTSDVASWLNNSIGANLYLTNCILAGVTNLGSTAATNAVAQVSSSGTFQTIGAGSHYLADGSSWRDYANASPNIDAALAASLKNLTTYPPQVLSTDFTTSTTLSPQVTRDDLGNDLGYHYDALDYYWNGLNVTNATLTLTNGVAVGFYGTIGTRVRTGAKFVSEGLPDRLNRLVRWHAVQEQSSLTNPPSFIAIDGYDSTMRFTDVAMLADRVSSRYAVTGGTLGTWAFTDCSLRGVFCGVVNYLSSPPTLSMTNNFLERCTVSVEQGYVGTFYPVTLTLRNNLFLSGALTLIYHTSSNSIWGIYDNLLDSVTVSVTVSDYIHYPLPASYNGFRNSGQFGGGVKSLSVCDYQVGPLGSYYYPTNGVSGGLTNLVDAGSTADAGTVGLYHYTTRPDQVKEGNSRLDIGFHAAVLETVNAALNQPATQSSTYSHSANPIAAKAVDGNTDGVFVDGSVTSTGNDAQAWWQVDLGQSRFINTINLWNRTDQVPERLSNYYVLVSDEAFQSTSLSATLAQPRVSNWYQSATAGTPTSLPINRTGRYVRVQLAGTNYLSLAEVQVLAAAFTSGIDSDRDGVADYREDRNGNGVFDPGGGETDWGSFDNGASAGPALQTFTPLQ